MDPRDALDRIVYLLDRSLAPAPKVRAFVRARDLLAELGPDEIARRVRTGTLEELPGIGASTGRAIAEAVDGEVPTYLRRLEETTALPLTDEARPYREALRGDCHTHSRWSDGGATIAQMATTARDLGHDYLVLTDHSPRLTVAHGLDEDRLRAQLVEIAELNEVLAPFRILTGMEVDILEDGTLDLADELLAELDVVVASAHSKLRLPRDAMTRRLVLAVASPHVDILGHCTNRKLSASGVQPASDAEPKRPPSTFDADLVFAACARFDTAVEINCRPERQDPPDELLDLALDYGCKLAIDTDAHAPGQLEWQVHGCEKAARLDVPIDQVVNTWAADELIGWATSHPTG